MSDRNRRVGHDKERKAAKAFREIGYHDVKTSRSCNRARDDEKVDLCNHNEAKYGRLPYNVQCKHTKSHLNLAEELAKMPQGDEINVIFYTKTTPKKRGSKTIFVVEGNFAVLAEEDFLAMAKRLRDYEEWETQQIEEGNVVKQEG